MSLVLSSDLKAISQNNLGMSIREQSFQPPWDYAAMHKAFEKKPIRAVTDRGVKLGMSEAQVKRKLGKPDRVMWSSKFGAREFIYRRETGKDSNGMWKVYANYYLFKGGKLCFIELTFIFMPG